MNRIERIRAKRQELDAQEQKRQDNMRETIALYKQKIEALTPEISEILELAKELLNNGLPLGEYVREFIGKRQKFECDGFNHTLGFYFRHEDRSRYLYGIGIEGGGCCGRDFCVSIDGEIIENPLDHVGFYRDYDSAYWDFCNKCKRFLCSFDNFRKEFLDYVDSL